MKILNLLFVLGLSLFGIIFAIANRSWVPLSLDPFSTNEPALAIELPLYGVVFGAIFLGMIIGSSVTWVGQGSVRRNLRATKREEKSLRKKVAIAATADEKSGLPAVTTPSAPPPKPAQTTGM